MLKSKYFWIAMIILLPFIIIWIMEGFEWAFATLLIMGMLFLLILASTRRKRRYYYYYDDGDYDEEIVIERRPRRPLPSSDRIRDLYFPKGLRNIHQEGLNNLGQMQRDDLNRTLKRLRRLR